MHSAAMHSAAMHPALVHQFRVPRSYTIEEGGAQLVKSPPLPWGGLEVGLKETGLPFWLLSWTSSVYT